MSRLTQKGHAWNPPSWEWEWESTSKNMLFARNWIKYPNLYKQSCFQAPPLYGWGGGGHVQKHFVRNCMNYPDLHRNIMQGNHTLLEERGMGSISKIFMLEIILNVQLGIK